jgi:hypothetical protein
MIPFTCYISEFFEKSTSIIVTKFALMETQFRKTETLEKYNEIVAIHKAVIDEVSRAKKTTSYLLFGTVAVLLIIAAFAY